MTLATAKYFLNELYEFAGKKISDDIVRINMGAVSIYPMIGGSFDSEDDEFRAPRNRLYVGATLSQEIRDAVSGISPTSLGAGTANGDVKIVSVMDLASETYHLIDGFNGFRIAGIDLTVPDGEDEALSLVAADGLTKAADIAVVSTEDGQRIICTLASAVPAGTYYVRLVSHGLDPAAPLVTALHRVTVKAATVPPAPEPIAESEDGSIKVMSVSGAAGDAGLVYGHSWTMAGEGLLDANGVEGKEQDTYLAGWSLRGSIAGESQSGAILGGASEDGGETLVLDSTFDVLDAPTAGTYENCELVAWLSKKSDREYSGQLVVPVGTVVVA